MATFDFDSLTTPVSEAEPCGPDLDLVGDPEFYSFTARAEGILPTSFFAFDRNNVDFIAEFKTLQSLLGRSRDLRLMVILAKFAILDRDLRSFCAAIDVTRDLLKSRWDHVHPQATDGDHIMRVVTLQRLDDQPDTILPLESATLFQTRRFGRVSYRSYLLSTGKAVAKAAEREGEEDERVPSPNDLRIAVEETDLAELAGSRDRMRALAAAIADIEAQFADRAGSTEPLSFEQLKARVADILAYLEASVVARDPSLAVLAPATAGPADAAGGTSGPGFEASRAQIADLETARRLLRSAASYFARSEPSSPVRLFLAQADALIGKSFMEVVQLLVPDYASQATFRPGKGLPLALPVERLAGLLAEMDMSAEASPAVEPPATDGWGEPDAAAESPDPDAPDSSDGTGSNAEAGEASDPPAVTPPPEAIRRSEPAEIHPAKSRAEALQRIDQVAAWLRGSEPSSPLPALLEQARAIAGRDFVSLLREILPNAALQVDE